MTLFCLKADDSSDVLEEPITTPVDLKSSSPERSTNSTECCKEPEKVDEIEQKADLPETITSATPPEEKEGGKMDTVEDKEASLESPQPTSIAHSPALEQMEKLLPQPPTPKDDTEDPPATAMPVVS